MLNTNHFAIEQLETRNETFWICVPYVGTCVVSIWGVKVYYPCIKYRWIWI